ncbi:hypothetical protein RDWZM_008145, partial [Blomia tropicalis]
IDGVRAAMDCFADECLIRLLVETGRKGKGAQYIGDLLDVDDANRRMIKFR